MTSTAQWLHFKLGIVPADQHDTDPQSLGDEQSATADLVAQQRAMASQPLSVSFITR